MRSLLVLLLLLVRGPEDAARRRSATEHFNRGQKLYAAEKWQQALAEFKAGYAAYPLPAWLVNIGQSYHQLGERKKAMTLYQQYLDLQPADDSMRPRVERLIEDLEREERVSAESARPAKLNLAPRPPPEPPPAPVARALERHEEPAPAAEEASSWYGKWWVWTLAGVLVAGGVAAGVAASSSSPGGVQPGSLGIVDGRR